ncbi:MAG: hypothetical protein A2254_15975 [Ignavibacteria bacterium RIFOXYA2_FULL_35_9]|nr:MAG: hypothetical protein A2254_15975 [Ignavibacteria bacterium RIFOXYA2_FULL_35_9]
MSLSMTKRIKFNDFNQNSHVFYHLFLPCTSQEMKVETNHKTGFYEKVRQELRLRNYSHKTIKSYLSCLHPVR